MFPFSFYNKTAQFASGVYDIFYCTYTVIAQNQFIIVLPLILTRHHCQRQWFAVQQTQWYAKVFWDCALTCSFLERAVTCRRLPNANQQLFSRVIVDNSQGTFAYLHKTLGEVKAIKNIDLATENSPFSHQESVLEACVSSFWVTVRLNLSLAKDLCIVAEILHYRMMKSKLCVTD